MGQRIASALGVLALLSACGGGGSGSGTVTGGGAGSTPTPAPTAACSLRERQNWAFAQLNEWYLFPETLPASLDPTPYGSVDAYVDALTAGARAQSRDRYFTYITSIAAENAYYNSGSSAGYGIRLATDPVQRRLFINEAFHSAPALAAGIDRGAEITAIGTSVSDLRNVSDIMASGGSGAITTALGPDTPGTTRVFRVTDSAGTRTVTVSKADYTLTPVSSRYGARVIEDGGKKVGYINLRTFISTANAPLRTAFANFRAQGITELIIDFRYNGGGLVSVAELMGDLMAANRSTADVFTYTTFRASKSSENETRRFAPQPESIAPTRVAFIGTGSTASASELVINTFLPYLGGNAGLIGANTYGKPVGQLALDRSACDDRLRVVAFALQNSARQGAYFTGLADTMQSTCRAADDIAYPLGDPAEASTRAALDFLAGRSCTAIAGSGQSSQALRTGAPRVLLTPERPTTLQREVPGAF